MTFEAPVGQDPSLEEFNVFLDTVSKLHEYIMFASQPEYLKNSLETSRLQIASYHELKVVHLCRKNPFDIELSFNIIQEGVATYWPLLQYLIKFCQRYGANVNDLQGNLDETKLLFEELYNRFISNSVLHGFLEELRVYNNSEKLYLKMISKLNSLMKNKEFRRYYDLI